MKTLIAIVKSGKDVINIFAENNQFFNSDQEYINFIGFVLSQNEFSSWTYSIKQSYHNKHLIQCEYFVTTSDGIELVLCGYGDNPTEALSNVLSTCQHFVGEYKFSQNS